MASVNNQFEDGLGGLQRGHQTGAKTWSNDTLELFNGAIDVALSATEQRRVAKRMLERDKVNGLQIMTLVLGTVHSVPSKVIRA